MQNQSRQLAAIMFTDIVGYTALMGNDEQNAFDLLKKNRELQKPIIEQLNGRWIKELGDGVMASFNTVSDAVNAAIKIQESCNAAKDFQLRIGIHLGEVVFENDDVFGDGVNIASRIQAIAKPGCIYVSESVHNNISNKKDITTKFIKEETLKNVKEPVRIYEIKLNETADQHPETFQKPKKRSTIITSKKRKIIFGVIALLILGALLSYFLIFTPKKGIISAKTITGEKSIAVLPFKNMSEEKENQHFTDGMMDEILNKLSKIKEFRVISRTSVEQYRGTNKKMSEIAKELGVVYILEGSAQKYGDEIKVLAQLIKADAEEQHLWSENYTKPYKEVFALQSEIANSIATELQAKLTPQEHDLINKAVATNIEAYDFYLRGKEYIIRYWADDDQKNLANARNLFQKSLDIDSVLAKAWAGLGIVYYHMNSSQVQILSENYLDSVLYYCNKALSLDANLADAYWMIGRYHHNRDNLDEAISYFKKGIEIDPNHININWNLAKAFHSIRNYVKSFYYFNKVFPLVKGEADLPSFFVESAAPHLSLGNFQIVDSLIEHGILLRPDMLNGYASLVRSQIVQGKLDKALVYAKKMFEIDPNSSIGLRSLYNTYAFLKDFKNALKFHEMYEQLKIKNYGSDGGIILGTYLQVGYILWNSGKMREAEMLFNHQINASKKALKLGRWPGNFNYDLASTYAFLGNTKLALEYLRAYDEEGFNDGLEYFIMVDPLFESLRTNKEFKEIVEKAQAKKAAIRVQVKELERKGGL